MRVWWILFLSLLLAAQCHCSDLRKLDGDEDDDGDERQPTPTPTKSPTPSGELTRVTKAPTASNKAPLPINETPRDKDSGQESGQTSSVSVVAGIVGAVAVVGGVMAVRRRNRVQSLPFYPPPPNGPLFVKREQDEGEFPEASREQKRASSSSWLFRGELLGKTDSRGFERGVSAYVDPSFIHAASKGNRMTTKTQTTAFTGTTMTSSTSSNYGLGQSFGQQQPRQSAATSGLSSTSNGSDDIEKKL